MSLTAALLAVAISTAALPVAEGRSSPSKPLRDSRPRPQKPQWPLLKQRDTGRRARMRQLEAQQHTKPASLQHPRDVTIYVVSGANRPQGDCSAKTWVSDALEFGFRVLYYSNNGTHQARDGSNIPTRIVEHFGALAGVRDNRDVWPRFAANILEDVLAFNNDTKFIMRIDDDSYLHPGNLWRALKGLKLETRHNWMIGDCGNDEHHALWCSGGAGIVISRPLATKLVKELRAGSQSKDICALVARNDDDAMGICAAALHVKLTNHHGFHWWSPTRLDAMAPLPWYTWWPRLGRFMGVDAALDGCPAEKLGPFAVTRDWVTYHHMTCDLQHALHAASRDATGAGSKREEATFLQLPANAEASPPLCAGLLGEQDRPGGYQPLSKVDDRCRAAPERTRQLLCSY